MTLLSANQIAYIFRANDNTSYLCFYYGEYQSCGDNKQKVADNDEDDSRSFYIISLTGKYLIKHTLLFN